MAGHSEGTRRYCLADRDLHHTGAPELRQHTAKSWAQKTSSRSSTTNAPTRQRFGLWSHVSPRELKAKPGETYYFVAGGGELLADEFTLNQVDADEGRQLVAFAHLSAFHPK
jgi:hypothetical protein